MRFHRVMNRKNTILKRTFFSIKKKKNEPEKEGTGENKGIK